MGSWQTGTGGGAPAVSWSFLGDQALGVEDQRSIRHSLSGSRWSMCTTPKPRPVVYL